MAGRDLFASSAGLDVTQPAPGTDLFKDPNAPGAVKKGLKSSVAGLKGSAAGALALAGDLLGVDSLKQYGLETAQKAQEEGAASAMKVEDIENPTDFIDYAKYGAGYLVPQLATAVASGVLGRLLGRGVAAASGISDPAKALLARNAGMTAGLATSSIAQEAGSIYPDAVEAGLPDAAARAVTGGTLAGSLDVIPELLAVRMLGGFGKKQVNPAKGLSEILKGGVKGAAVGAGTEATTELAQTAIERIAANKDLNDAEAASEFLNAGALGFLGGGFVGGPVGAVNASSLVRQQAAQPQPQAQPADTGEAGAPPPAGPGAGPVAPDLTPFQSFDSKGLGLVFGADELSLAGEVNDPLAPSLAGQEAARQRIAALTSELKGAAQKDRPKEQIARERKEAEADLAQWQQRERNARTLMETPEYKEKSSLAAQPTIIGEQPTSTQPQQIVSLAEDEMLRRAEQEAQNAARQGSFKGGVRQERQDGTGSGQAAGSGAGNRVLGTAQGQGQTRGESSVETQLGLIKRQRGLLLNENEAKAVRAFEKNTPAIEVSSGGGPRSTAKIVTPEARRENFAAAYSSGVNQLMGELTASGVMTPERGKAISMKLERAVEAAFTQPDADKAAAVFNAAFDSAFNKKLPKQDIETFRQQLTERVRAALPVEVAEPSDRPLRSNQPDSLAGLPASAEQRTLFNKGAAASQVQFSHWGDVQGGFTDPSHMGKGVKGADWPLAHAIGLQYTSAVVKGAPYREPAVQSRPQFEGSLPADKIYTARSDDPLLQQARVEVMNQFGPSEGIAWMQYAKKVRDLGYDAMLYNGGQLRIFTPQQVGRVETNLFSQALPVLPEEMIQTRAREIAARHEKTGGSSTYVRSGQDAAGTSAYAVSGFKARELVIPGHPTVPYIASYIRANDDLLGRDGYLLGTWYDESSNKTYLDVSLSVPDMRTAMKIAREADQKAITDLRTITTINLSHPLFDVAQQYNADNDMAPIQEVNYIEFDPEVGRQIAAAYEQLQTVNPDPRVKIAYDALAREEQLQFEAVSKAIKIEPWTKEGQPYQNSAEMRADVFGNNHLWVFAGGEGHPYRTPEQTFRGRAVHDLFAHARTGFEFGPRGELNATRIHAQMYSEVALPALIVDNIGQNAWVNFSAANEGKPQAERAFAEQKVDLLPEALWRPLLAQSRQVRADAHQRRMDVLGQKGDEVLSYLEAVLGTPKNLEVRLVSDVDGGVGALRLRDAKALIELSTNAKDILSVAAHEGYHYIEERVMTGPERRIVRQAFANGTPEFNLLLEKAREYDRNNQTKLAEEIQAAPAEARAYGFEFWRRGELQVSNPVSRVFASIRRLLERIRNYIDGIGFTSYEDIFLGIEKGHYARQELQGLRGGTVEQSYLQAIEPDAVPGSAVFNRNRGAASQAKGRPDWIKTSADLTKMRRLLKALVSEGTEAKDWYRRSGEAILRWAGGDKAKAGKMAALVAMYSPRTGVGEDLRKAVQHYAQWEAKQTINAGGTRHQAEYGSKILDGAGFRDYQDRYTLPGNPDSAPKITSFFKNLMLTIDPTAYPPETQDSTIDMWMSHIFGFGSKDGKLTDSNYWWADAEIKRMANELGMAPDQAQAAVWVAIKARGNMTRSLARKQAIDAGWFNATLAPANERTDLMGKGGRPTIYKLKPKRESDYMVNWIRLALSVPFSKANFDDANYSYAEAFRDISDRSLPLKRLDFDFEVQAGLFDDIAFGKVSQGELTFYSRAASLSEVAQRVREGELPRSQLNALWAEAVDHRNAPEGLRQALQRPAFSETQGAVGSFKRFYSEYLSSGLNLARHSAGFKNVFNVLTSYTQRKNRLIADAVERGLSQWTGNDAGTQADKAATSAALLKRTENGWTATSPELLNLRQSLSEKQRTMFDQATKMIAAQLDAEFKADAESYRKVLDQEQFAQWYAERHAQVERLKNEGYFPERRYGDHVVHAFVEQDGKRLTVYYSQHEREADARNELAELKTLLPSEGLTFEYGYRYRADYDASLSFSQFLDLANRHGVSLTQAEKERIGKALIAADSTRRNRVFRRKNVAGYSEDGMRVLAEFGVTMANKVAYAELGGAVNDAIAGKEVDVKFTTTGAVEVNTYDRNMWTMDGERAGFYRNLADQTVDFVMSPRQGSKLSRGLRLAATAQFLGGSAAAAVVQLTSLPMNTVPWLTQHTGYADAVAKTLEGSRLAVKHLRTIKDLPALLDTEGVRMEGIDEVDGLRRALQIAAQDGTILDTEIYQIMGLSRGQEYSFSGRVQQAVRTWMLPFRLSENFNRVSTFVAAYKVAKDKNLSNDQAYKLAQDTVYSTQFRYDEANRPALARSDIGALLFTFKTYPIFATELLTHLAREKPQAAVYMMLSYMFMAGIEGLPFAEDIEDIIDTIAQRVFGSPFNSKRALHNVLKSASEAVLGTDLSSVFMHGAANELTGLSFASRVGLGNLLPGTRLATADSDYARNMSEALGPVGSLVVGALHGLDSASRGQWMDGAKQILPLAGQNLVKGWEQWEKGFATDLGGRKLVDVDGYNAFWQALGFSSGAMVKAYDSDKMDKQTAAFYTRAKEDFERNLSKAIREHKPEQAAAVVEAVTAWNVAHPDMPMAISPSSVRKQVVLGNLPINERTFKLLPKGLRGQSETALGLEHRE